MGEDEDQKKLEDILDENATSLGKMRDLTDDLEAVVEHEKRVIDEAPDAPKPPEK